MLDIHGREMPDFTMNMLRTIDEFAAFYEAPGEQQTTGNKALDLDIDNYGPNVFFEPNNRDLRNEEKRIKAVEAAKL